MGLTSMEDFLDSIDAIAWYTFAHAIVPGQVETYTTILDFKDLALYEWPVAQLLYMVKRMKASYKLRGNKIFAVNVHWLISAASQVIFTFLPAHISEKIFIVKTNGSKDLLKFIDADHLEQKYGGTLPNKETDFFPPRYNP